MHSAPPTSILMTIDSSWIFSLFTKQPPFHPQAVFCDGQIRLMRGFTQNLLTWDDYIYQQFHSHVAKFFRTTGVSTVILAFDDYANVPQAKSMTQIKRRKHIPQLQILEREPLPPVCPSGSHWEQCISNRTFKAKIIALVIDRLPGLLRLLPGQTLIIDYKGHPVAYTCSASDPLSGELQVQEVTALKPLGEAQL